ncbi:protoheme IX farnesyltransferase [Geobacter sp.]|uniref:protoheme IX farnesyltransferase n=1 Tax=Geobacter sp. TaxID=46610 RepID=UPI00262D7C01|nr:protoheme IX farnesyltransferase [Geobacter sp.]
MADGAAGSIGGMAPRSSRRKGSILAVAKPGIVAAVLLEGFAGMALASRGMPAAGPLLGCLTALALAAGGAAMLNASLEAERDARMERLARRTALLGQIGTGRVRAAALGLMAGGLGVALARLPLAAGLLIALAAASYIFLYTLWLKGRSPYGAIPGGIPGALPALVGYRAAAPAWGVDGVILFIVMLLWQPPHFWALALAYRDDYRRAGIPVLPVARGIPYTKALLLLYATALLPASLALWLFGPCSGRFAEAALLLGGGFLASLWWNMVRRERYGRAFAASVAYLLLLLAAVAADMIVPLP